MSDSVARDVFATPQWTGDPLEPIDGEGSAGNAGDGAAILVDEPEWDMYADPPGCPDDGQPCPDEHDIDLRILREVTP